MSLGSMPIRFPPRWEQQIRGDKNESEKNESETVDGVPMGVNISYLYRKKARVGGVVVCNTNTMSFI